MAKVLNIETILFAHGSSPHSEKEASNIEQD